MEEDDVKDPVSAIKMLEDIGNQVVSLQEMTPGMVGVMINNNTGDIKRVHPLDEVIDTLNGCRNALLSKYGKMLWESADGPVNAINQSHSQEHVYTVPEEVLAAIFEAARAKAYAEAIENGVSVQSSTGKLGSIRGRGLVSRLLGRASSREVRRSADGDGHSGADVSSLYEHLFQTDEPGDRDT